MSQTTVKYIVNGFLVSDEDEIHYAATLDEAMYWVGQLLGSATTKARRKGPPEQQKVKPVPETSPSYDPLANQQAVIFPVTGNGYIVSMLSNAHEVWGGARNVPYDQYCVSLDDVRANLDLIFTIPKVPPAPEIPSRVE